MKDVTLEACPNCGEDLGRTTEVITRIIEELPEPPPIETVQYNLYEYV